MLVRSVVQHVSVPDVLKHVHEVGLGPHSGQGQEEKEEGGRQRQQGVEGHVAVCVGLVSWILGTPAMTRLLGAFRLGKQVQETFLMNVLPNVSK